MRDDENTFVSGSTTDMETEEEMSTHTTSTTTSTSVTLSVFPKHESIGMNCKEDSTQICATMTATKDKNDNDARAYVDIMVALDVSGSMQTGNKLALCKKTLEMLLRVLQPKDRFGLVSYATDARLEIPLQHATVKNKQEALGKIQSLYTRGNTNMSSAIGLAFQELNHIGLDSSFSSSPNNVRSVFLLTDGYANEGISGTSALIEFTSTLAKQGSRSGSWRSEINQYEGSSNQYNPSSSPINLFCFGYGADHNSDLLEGLADATEGGSYFFVENDVGVGAAFGDALGGILSVVAQNAVLTFAVPPEAAAMGVLIEKIHHDNVVRREDGSYAVSVGDFYAEESRDVIVEVKMAKNKADLSTCLSSVAMATTSIPHAIVSLAYSDTIRKMPVVSKPVVCPIGRPQGSCEVSQANSHVLAHWLRLEAIREMEAAQQDANQGRCSQAGIRYQSIHDQVERFRGGASFRDGTSLGEMLGEIQKDTLLMQGGLGDQPILFKKKSATIQAKYKRQRGQACTMMSAAVPDGSSNTVFNTSTRSSMAKMFGAGMEEEK